MRITHYRAFPNLYAIRGNPARDPKKWVASVDLMLSLQPEFLVPCHLNAIVGKDEIRRLVVVVVVGVVEVQLLPLETYLI